jgi:hypothetical protein
LLEDKTLYNDGDIVEPLRGINHRDSARSLAREGEKAAPDLPVKLFRLLIETIRFGPRVSPSGEANRRRQIKQECEIG